MQNLNTKQTRKSASRALDIAKPARSPASRLKPLTSFDAVVPLFIKWHHDHADATIETYRWHLLALRRYLRLRAMPEVLESVTRELVVDFMSHMSKSLAEKSQLSRYVHLKAFFNFCVDWKFIEDNPFRFSRPPKIHKVYKPFMTEEEFAKALAVCFQDTFLGARRYALLKLLATTGLRIKEAWALTRADVDDKAMEVRVSQTKSGELRKPILDPEADLAISRYLAYRTDAYPHLWVSEERRPIASPHSLGTDLAYVYQRANIKPRDRAHAIRRTAAANALRKRVNNRYIEQQFGWAPGSKMLAHYTAAMRLEEQAAQAEMRTIPKFGARVIKPRGA